MNEKIVLKGYMEMLYGGKGTVRQLSRLIKFATESI